MGGSEQRSDMTHLACWDFFLAKLSCLSATLEKVLELGWHMQRKGGEVLGMELLSLLTLKVNLGKGGHKDGEANG